MAGWEMICKYGLLPCKPMIKSFGQFWLYILSSIFSCPSKIQWKTHETHWLQGALTPKFPNHPGTQPQNPPGFLTPKKISRRTLSWGNANGMHVVDCVGGNGILTESVCSNSQFTFATWHSWKMIKPPCSGRLNPWNRVGFCSEQWGMETDQNGESRHLDI